VKALVAVFVGEWYAVNIPTHKCRGGWGEGSNYRKYQLELYGGMRSRQGSYLSATNTATSWGRKVSTDVKKLSGLANKTLNGNSLIAFGKSMISSFINTIVDGLTVNRTAYGFSSY